MESKRHRRLGGPEGGAAAAAPEEAKEEAQLAEELRGRLAHPVRLLRPH